jgi:hypothetical protein
LFSFLVSPHSLFVSDGASAATILQKKAYALSTSEWVTVVLREVREGTEYGQGIRVFRYADRTRALRLGFCKVLFCSFFFFFFASLDVTFRFNLPGALQRSGLQIGQYVAIQGEAKVNDSLG